MAPTCPKPLLYPRRKVMTNSMPSANAQTIRRLALFSAIMASGGTLLIPREAWLVLTALLALSSLRFRIGLGIGDSIILLWVFSVTLLQLAIDGYANPVSLLSRLFTFLTALLLLKLYSRNKYLYIKSDLFFILSIFAVQAIITSLLGNTIPGAFEALQVGELVYYHIGYIFNFHYPHNIVSSTIRPNGLFYEPGVYQIYLSIFLFQTLFWKRDLRWIVIALCAVLTTLSTIGVIIAVIQIIVFSISYLSKAKGPNLLLGCLAIPIAIGALLAVTIDNASDKFLGEGRGSTIARVFDAQVGANIIAENPLRGIGFSTDAYQAHSRQMTFLVTDLPEREAENRRNSNGLLQIPISIGIPLSLPLFIGLFRQRLFERRLLFALIIALSLAGQSLSFSVFFMMIFFSGMIANSKDRDFPLRE